MKVENTKCHLIMLSATPRCLKAKELMRTCEEDVELAKCEGSCVSSTMPSAMERSD